MSVVRGTSLDVFPSRRYPTSQRNESDVTGGSLHLPRLVYY